MLKLYDGKIDRDINLTREFGIFLCTKFHIGIIHLYMVESACIWRFLCWKNYLNPSCWWKDILMLLEVVKTSIFYILQYLCSFLYGSDEWSIKYWFEQCGQINLSCSLRLGVYSHSFNVRRTDVKNSISADSRFFFHAKVPAPKVFIVIFCDCQKFLPLKIGQVFHKPKY